MGQTEANIRQALRLVDAMAPCVVLIDEVEKALSGVAVQRADRLGRLGADVRQLLTWLNDHESDVFVVCTANDVSKLPPEFARAERFDGMFFLDLPGSREKEIDLADVPREVRARRRAAPAARYRVHRRRDQGLLPPGGVARRPAVEAAQNIVPVAVTAGEAVETLRSWAAGRCLSADRPGLYSRVAAGPGKAGRSVHRGDPSAN